MRCESKGCVYEAMKDSKFCVNHRPAPVIPAAQPADQDSFIISLSEIPAPRANEVALTLLRTLETLGEGKALKVRMRKFSKPSLVCTQRYALTKGLRIGLRYIGEWAYLWKMTPDQVKAAEQKAQRLVKAREKKGRKVAA